MTTARNTTTSNELPDIGTRFIVQFIDGAILFAVGSAIFLLVREPGLGAGFIIALAYYWVFLTRNQGQTPGKALMKIRVIKVDGSPISDSDAILRYFGYIVNTFCIIGWA